MSIKKTGSFGIGKAVRAYKLAKSSLPVVIANNSKNHFSQGFRQSGGQTDASRGGWQRRKKDPKGAQRGILIGRKGGRMWKALQVISSTFSKIEVGILGIAYAERHNEGLDGMPQREILGPSAQLDSSNRKIILKELNDIFKR